MLELRPNCECCSKDLPASTSEAYICSFECTFCKTCTESNLNFTCPNCDGQLVVRPARPEKYLPVKPLALQEGLLEADCTE